MTRGSSLIIVSLSVLFWIGSGCVSPPPPNVLYKDAVTVVQLQHDPRAEQGHAHPAIVAPEVLKHVLAGLRVHKRGDLVLGLFTGEPEVETAFSPAEINDLAPKLSQALALAKPTEAATFYRRVSDSTIGLGVTSGGMVVRDGLLYVVLANHRSRMSDVMREGVSYELDPVRDPLLSLRSRAFRLSFVIDRPVVHPTNPWDYIDPGKMIALDLQTLEVYSQRTSLPPPVNNYDGAASAAQSRPFQ